MSRQLSWYAAAAVVVLMGLTFWRVAVSQTVNNAVEGDDGKQVTPPPPSIAVRHEQDVIFAQPGGETLKLDIALPFRGNGPFPAVVCLHGGGWVGGDRKQMAVTTEVLAKRGYVAVSPDYRLAPKHPFPACIEDVKAAVRWLRANAGKYRIDPQQIGVCGLSAGGHLACLMGVTENSDGLDGNGGNAQHASTVQAVVAFSAPVALNDDGLWVEPTLTKNLIPLLGGTPRDRMDLCLKASPLSYSPRHPAPTLLIHGKVDAVVPIWQVHAFAEKINHAGGKARVVEMDGEGHTFKGGALLQSIDQMLTFLDGTLKK